MRAIFVVVGNVLAEQPFQMTFIDRDNVIEQVAAAAAHPTFGDTVLPGAFEGGPDRSHF
jgi:hypothetical protein